MSTPQPPVFILGGALPLPSDPPEGVDCPCGCGKRLVPYNGARPLVCYPVWTLVRTEDKRAIMGFGYSDNEREEAALRVLALAEHIKEGEEE